ncbi:head morphogenesis protein [Roseibium sp. RKSG952]|uniref:head morphogenesis protein n=1 Tax=Roseibium sp. RKSG952 TaxID=2529384 RepID=UPI0012BD5772|nr:head morphogenesis protein [Roseibium sp. RKSG952]MTH96417.1 head morphogenesis protein [Roseibium sp. RKSG952]
MSNKDPFDDLTAHWSNELRKAFLTAVQEVRDRQKVSVITGLIERGDIDAALRAVGMDPQDYRLMDRVLAQLMNAGGDSFALEIERQAPVRSPEGAIVRFFFDGRNPNAELWLRTRSSDLIRQIVDDQQVMIREHLRSGLEAGQNPRTTALSLVGKINPATRRREGGVIGLTSGQEAWQRRYAAELASDDPAELQKALKRGLRDKRFDASVKKAIKSGEPIPAATRSKMVTAYRNRSLKYRADVIARTETIRALGQTQTLAYEQAILDGRVTADQLTKYPMSARDERVRHRHRAVEKLNEGGVPWNQAYQVPPGMAPQMHAPYDEPMCRCREKVRINRFLGLT